MKRVVGLAVGVFMSIFLNAAVNAGPNSAAAVQGTEGQVQKPEQGMQSGQPTPDNKAKLSKRNQAQIKQAEAAKAKNENTKSRLSKRNQVQIKQAEAAKNRRDLIEKSNAGSTK